MRRTHHRTSPAVASHAHSNSAGWYRTGLSSGMSTAPPPQQYRKPESSPSPHLPRCHSSSFLLQKRVVAQKSYPAVSEDYIDQWLYPGWAALKGRAPDVLLLEVACWSIHHQYRCNPNNSQDWEKHRKSLHKQRSQPPLGKQPESLAHTQHPRAQPPGISSFIADPHLRDYGLIG